MIIEDDRTTEQKTIYTCLVVMKDSFMSGWGLAEGGNSYAAWACKPEDKDKVLRWVRSRGEARNVHIVSKNKENEKWMLEEKGHYHIYVVEKGHRALQE